MSIRIDNILDLIKTCQEFDRNTFSENDTVELFAKELDINKVTFRLFLDDISIESVVIYNAHTAGLGEEIDFRRATSNDRIVSVKIIRCHNAPSLSDEKRCLLDIFGESVISGICVKNLINSYEEARYYDSMTHLTNVNFFLTYLERLLASGKSDLYSVACVNIKNCGAINRIFGSDITDKIITDFAQDSLELFDHDHYEILSRLSSDSFIMIALNGNIDRILASMNNSEVSVDVNGDIVEYNVKIRAGVVKLASIGRKSSDVVHMAEHALQFSRHKDYPDIYFINSDGNVEGDRQNISVTEIRSALNSGQFHVYFMPLLRTNGSYYNKVLAGAVAMIRWRKNGRLLDPYKLVPKTANNNLLRDMDDFMFRKACDIISSWDTYGLISVPIGIPLVSFDYFNTAFADNILKCIDRYNIDRKKIVLVFDEESFNSHYDEMNIATQKFTKAGVDIALGNYGADSSTLKLLSRFTFKYLNIDPELINTTSEKERTLLESTVSLAQRLGYKVLCTYPADENTARAAYDYGCRLFMGELFDKPLSERFFKRRLTVPDYYNNNRSSDAQ